MNSTGEPCEIKEVGDIANKKATPVRIVHISDTHLKHHNFLADGHIPNGDILVHSGDFSYFRFKRHLYAENDFQEQLRQMREFFDQLPHKHKIFVSGNHETNLPKHSVKEIQNELPGVIYLQDASVNIEGIKFYGTPWCGRRWYSFARSFIVPYDDLGLFWEKIPLDVDVLVTHMPPRDINDLGCILPWQEMWQKASFCQVCQRVHEGFTHFGCPYLRRKIFQIRPKAHLFGHVHESNGYTYKDGILFSNAVMQRSGSAHVIDYYRVDSADTEEDAQVLQADLFPRQSANYFSYCNIV